MDIKKKIEELIGKNINELPIHIEHVKLTRCNDESRFRSNCPVCKEGVLVCMRHSETFILVAKDTCSLCGQRFIYDDINALRLRDPITQIFTEDKKNIK